MTNREKVLEEIDFHFDKEAITLKEFSLFPGGVIVQDKKGGEMLFYWDILNDCLAWTDKKGGKSYVK